jgi:photosystem II stability/assembly factor-like uncharacterized protein
MPQLNAMNTPTQNTSVDNIVYQFAASKGFSSRAKAICFAARFSGLCRSTDGGRKWQPSFGSLDLQSPFPALTVALSPDFEQDGSVFVGTGNGILRSSDSGETWENTQVPSPPPVITALVVSPNYVQDGILLAATLEDGVLCSSDRGRRWIAWNFGLLDLNTLCLAISPDFANDETLFIGTQSGIFRSTNGGRSWREVNLPVGFEPVLSLAVSPSFGRDATLFAGTENDGLLRSGDGGQTWQRLGKSTFNEPVNGIVLAPDFSNRPEIFVLHGGSLLVSTDGSKTWKSWRDGALAGNEITAIYAPTGFDLQSPALVGCADGTILRI